MIRGFMTVGISERRFHSRRIRNARRLRVIANDTALSARTTGPVASCGVGAHTGLRSEPGLAPRRTRNQMARTVLEMHLVRPRLDRTSAADEPFSGR